MAKIKRAYQRKQTIDASYYYNVARILATDADYFVIFGKRGNGKTYQIMKHFLECYIKYGVEFIYIRRIKDYLKPSLLGTLFDGLEYNELGENIIKELTNNNYDHVIYYNFKFYLAYRNEKGDSVREQTPFGYAMSVSTYMSTKGSQYPKCDNVLFDEFLDNSTYIDNEFVSFMNLLSTIVRNRSTMKVFMCANSVDRHSIYFREMRLKNVKHMKPGDLEIYTYNDSPLKVAVEYTISLEDRKSPSYKYFSFDNPKLKMITEGAWELNNYPKKPINFYYKDVVFSYFIIFDEEVFKCEVVRIGPHHFTYIYLSDKDDINYDKDIIFQEEHDYRYNFRREITNTFDKLGEMIAYDFTTDKVFYQDNMTGDSINSYLKWCG